MARDKKPPEQKAGAPEWMATFSDMVTLLLCFFVLLFSMSTVDAAKWKTLVSIFNKDPSIFDKLNSVDAGETDFGGLPDEQGEAYIEASDAWRVIGEDVTDNINQLIGYYSQILGKNIIEVKVTDSEIVIEVPGDILFDTAKWDIKPEGKEMIAAAMASSVMPNVDALKEVRFEGHADIRKPEGILFGNLGLSQHRASAVYTFVTGLYPDVEKSFFGSIGYGDTRPLDESNNEEAWARNRRVSIIMVRSVYFDKEGNLVATEMSPAPGG